MNRYNEAKEIYAHYGIDTEKHLKHLKVYVFPFIVGRVMM